VDFFETVFTTVLEPDEMIASVRVPVCAGEHGWGFKLFSRRAGDFAEASAAATLAIEDDTPCLRLALGAVASVPVRTEDFVTSVEPEDSRWPARAAAQVAAAAEIEESARLPVDYRREVLQVLVEEALSEAARSRPQ
jgi:carbon-monoxide dehydrogenase medium subunit